MTDDDLDPIREDFHAWCRDHRAVLGRDRMRKPFEDGWRAGYAAGLREAARHQQPIEDHDR